VVQLHEVVEVQDVDLTAFDVRLPTMLVGMVLMQPLLKLTSEPFRCLPERKAEQIAGLERTLSIAKAADHGAEKTHFTLIPEYSIPGLDGIARIENILRDMSWPGGTIVIGGTDALSKMDYAVLCSEDSTTVDLAHNGPDHVQEGQWINCCITWVKTASGDLRRWLQPKIAPAWPEQNIVHAQMFRGGSVFVFRCVFENGPPCRFFSLVCFDWVGIVDGYTVPRQVLAALNQNAEEVSLSWGFIPQHNEKPSDRTFLSGAADFFENQLDSPFVRRERCCLVFANTAGRETPGRVAANGCSSLVFSPLSPFDLVGCHPTYTGKPTLLRGSDAIGRCRDVLFRERGACIHSFSQYVPGAVNLGAGGRTLPLRRASVHSIMAGLQDPRMCGAPVPACVKWVNDLLDDIPCLSQQIYDAPLAGLIAAAHETNIIALRAVDSVLLEKAIEYATWRLPDISKLPTADDWGDEQTAALVHLVHTLDILRIAGAQLDIIRGVAHATANLRNQSVELLAVNGPSHEQCIDHVERRFVPLPRRQVLLVTRDPQNAPKLKKNKNILRSDSAPTLGAIMDITDVMSGQIHIAFRELMDIYIAATTAADLENSLYARLTS